MKDRTTECGWGIMTQDQTLWHDYPDRVRGFWKDMKMDDRQYDEFKKDSSIWFLVLCFWSLLFCFVTAAAGVEIAVEKELAAENTRDAGARLQKLKPGISPAEAVGNNNDRLRRQLWKAGISGVYLGEGNKASKIELKRLITQIRSVEFKPRKQAPEPVIAVEPIPAVEPNETRFDAKPQPEPNLPGHRVASQEPEEVITPKLPYVPISEHTLQMLDALVQHPDQLEKPFELGEILFLSNKLKEAAVFYQQALNRASTDRGSSVQDRAWVLFQIGNCLRDDDPPAAQKIYKQLIAEYPDSPWTELAKARVTLIDWYIKDQPCQLIAERQQ